MTFEKICYFIDMGIDPTEIDHSLISVKIENGEYRVYDIQKLAIEGKRKLELAKNRIKGLEEKIAACVQIGTLIQRIAESYRTEDFQWLWEETEKARPKIQHWLNNRISPNREKQDELFNEGRAKMIERIMDGQYLPHTLEQGLVWHIRNVKRHYDRQDKHEKTGFDLSNCPGATAPYFCDETALTKSYIPQQPRK